MSNARRILFTLLFFQLCQLAVHSCPPNAVALDSTKIADSLVVHNEEIYAGEFSCLPTTANGTRTLLRMAVAIHNPTDCHHSFQPYEAPVRLFYNVSDSLDIVVKTGYFNISCIRDTTCSGVHSILNPDRVLHTACRTGGLSANCSLYIPSRAQCQWVDITELSLSSGYVLTLYLQPSLDGIGSGILDETPINIDFVPNSLLKRTGISTAGLILVIIAFTVPFAASFITSFVFVCRRNRDVVIRYQFSSS